MALTLLAACDSNPKEPDSQPTPVKAMDAHQMVHVLGKKANVRDGIGGDALPLLMGYNTATQSENLDLVLAYRNFTVGGLNVRLRSYEGNAPGDESIVGPVIRTSQNEQVSITVKNELSRNDTIQYWFQLPWPNAEVEALLSLPTVNAELNDTLYAAQQASMWGLPLKNAVVLDSSSTSQDSANYNTNQTYYQRFLWPDGQTDKPLQTITPGQHWSFPRNTAKDSVWHLMVSYNVATQENVLKVFMGVPPQGHNIPHAFNTTNLHTHGWHVSPREDNIYRQVCPPDSDPADCEFLGTSTYTYTLDDHPAGTFWYHPHVHGSTAIQVASGASGALIVQDDDLSAFPALEKASAPDREKLLVINQILFHPEIGELPDFNTMQTIYSVKDYTALESALPGTTINGVTAPNLTATQGQVERWRFIQSGFKTAVAFEFPEEVEVYQIAVDGLYFPSSREVSALYLAPGNRSDVVFKAKQAGTFKVKMITYTPECEYWPNDASVCPPDMSEAKETFFTVTVAASGSDEAAPTDLPHQFDNVNPDSVVGERITYFSIGGSPTQFKVNGMAFMSTEVISENPTVNTSERWNVYGNGHPYHIHVNPFQVTQFSGKETDFPMWKDVVYVQSDSGAVSGSAEILTRYEKFTGQFVMHCHILDHEDQGMMQNILITEPGVTPGDLHLPDTCLVPEDCVLSPSM